MIVWGEVNSKLLIHSVCVFKICLFGFSSADHTPWCDKKKLKIEDDVTRQADWPISSIHLSVTDAVFMCSLVWSKVGLFFKNSSVFMLC